MVTSHNQSARAGWFPDPDIVRKRALDELRNEAFRAAVEAEKLRLKTRRTLWQKALDLLPFTIVIKRKP